MRSSIFIFAVLLISSCYRENSFIAVLWTDQPELAYYCEYFNSTQDQYKIEAYYVDFPAQKLKETREYPDIVAGSWLKNNAVSNLYQSLDNFFDENIFNRDDFYSQLLAMGNIEGKQYLLPVSFNAPLAVFDRSKDYLLSNPFTLSFNEMQLLGKDYNTASRGAYTRMGFSPIWDDNFLLLIARLTGASFKEADPLFWNAESLDNAMNFAYNWTVDANTSIQAVEDFIFKYFYNPPEKLIRSGRILFTCMESNQYFTLDEDERKNIDFRWLAENDIIPLDEQSMFLGITKNGKAAEAFLKWFFNAETQRLLLEKSRQYSIMETSFGICGGFSAMRSITEQIFPQFYPDLLEHIPPQDFLQPSDELPDNWPLMKERVILPFLHERSRQANSDDMYPLEKRLADWQRVYR